MPPPPLQSRSGRFKGEKILLRMQRIQTAGSLVAPVYQVLEDQMIGHVTCIGEKRNAHSFGRETAREEATKYT